MSIININRSGKKVKVALQLDSLLIKKIEEYCEFVEIDDLSYFFEEAAKFIFIKDKKWKQHLKEKKSSKTFLVLEKNDNE